MFNNIKDKVKTFFKYSWTIFLARSTVAFGVVTGVVGAMDWSPIWATLSTGTWFTKEQLIPIAIAVVGQGIMFEVARRRSL